MISSFKSKLTRSFVSMKDLFYIIALISLKASEFSKNSFRDKKFEIHLKIKKFQLIDKHIHIYKKN